MELNCILLYSFTPPESAKTKENDGKISVGIINRKALSIPKWQGNIIHSKHLKTSKEEIVAVQIVVDMSGKVIQANALTGHPLLRSASETAALQAKFAPILMDNSPVNAKGLLIYKYKPDGEIDTDIASNDKDVVGLPVDLVKPQQTSCNCQFGNNPSVLYQFQVEMTYNS